MANPHTRDAAPGFGARLKSYRERAGISQAALGRLVDTSNSHISRLESGERLQPERDLVTRIATALNLDERETAYLMAEAKWWPTGLSLRVLDDLYGRRTA